MKLPRGLLAAYAAPCLPIAAAGLPIVVYLPPYYAGTLGLSLASVGLIFLLARCIDIPLDPVIGHLIDRTNSRCGRFRPWLAGGTLLFMAGCYAIFMARPGIGFAGALAAMLLFYLGYSVIYLSHTAWGATLSDDYHERSRVFAWWQVANMIGILLVLVLPALVLRMTPGSGAAGGIHAMGWAIIAALPVAAAIILLRVPERAALGKPRHSLSDIGRVLRLPLLRKLLVIDLLSNLAPGISGALFLFFFEAARGYPPAQASLLLLVYFVAGLACAPFWLWLARRASKHRTAAWAMLYYAVTQAAIIVLPAHDFWLAAVGMMLAGVPFTAPPFLVRAILADVSDAETLRSGEEKTALLYAVFTATTKLGYAIPVGLAYPVLGWIGFRAAAGAANSPDAILGLTLLFTVVPAGIALATAWLTWRWPHDAGAHARVAAALAAR